MKRPNPCLTVCFLFLCGFSHSQKTSNTPALPPKFVQQTLIFSSDKSEETKKKLIEKARKYSGTAMKWWVLYKKALMSKTQNRELFCNNMRFLSQAPAFPLKHNARLHQYSLCQQDISIDLSTFPDWLQRSAGEEWYKKAKKLKNETALMSASYSLYQLSEDKHLRERYLLTAIQIAKKTKDPRLAEWRQELYKLAPRYIPNPSNDQRLDIANDLRRARQFKKSLIYYRRILNTPGSSFREKNEAFKWARWIYKARKNDKKYLIATLQWKTWLKRQIKTDKRAVRIYHNIFYLLARTQWTLNQPAKALSTLSQMEKELKGRFSLFKVYRMRALIFDEQKKQAKAIELFEKALEETPPNPDLLEQTQWNYGWILKKAGRREESKNVLSDLLNTSESDYLPSRALFWIGGIYEEMGKQKSAREIYKQLIEKDPLSYYGLLAHYKTGQEIRIYKKESFKKTGSADYAPAEWLISLGEHSPARDFLKYKSKQYQKDEDKTTEEWSMLFYYMARARSFFPLFQMVGKLPLEERTRFFQYYADLMFPIVYEQEITKAEQRFNVKKGLMYALIRQESAWDPKARSPADAFGLTQVRPFVARQTAKKHGIPYKNARDLYIPEKNILIGTAFFKQLLNKYQSQFIVTAAVYNAGRTAVMRWLKKIPLDDPLFFIEEIPYEETRTYVRLLIRNFVFYKLLTGSERKLPFPEWILYTVPVPAPGSAPAPSPPPAPRGEF